MGNDGSLRRLATSLTAERPFFSRWTQLVAAKLQQFGDSVSPFVFVVAVAVLLALSAASSRGGYAHAEIEQYIPHYLSHRPILQKIFDFKKVEIIADYRPRPLSYLVDDLDVHFIAWSSRHNSPHFLSASYYLFWIFDCVVLWFYLSRRLRVHRFTAGLLICLLSTDLVVFSQSNYFHSAKPGGTFFLLIAFVILAECFRAALRRESAAKCALLACFGALLLFCACLFDEIPVAYAVCAVFMLSFEWFVDRKSRIAEASLYPLAAIVAVLCAFAWFDLVLYPKLIWAINGERASLAYQAGTASALLWNPVATLLGSVSVFADVFGDLVGTVPGVLGFVAMLALISVWESLPGSDFETEPTTSPVLRNRQPAIRRILLGGVLMIGCLYGMISRHHPVMRIGVRQSLYVLPLTIVFLLLVAASVPIFMRKGYLSRGKLQLILIVLVFSNLGFALTQRVFSHGDRYTEILLAKLHQPPLPVSEIPGEPDFAGLQSRALNSQIYKTLYRAEAEH